MKVLRDTPSAVSVISVVAVAFLVLSSVRAVVLMLEVYCKAVLKPECLCFYCYPHPCPFSSYVCSCGVAAAVVAVDAVAAADAVAAVVAVVAVVAVAAVVAVVVLTGCEPRCFCVCHGRLLGHHH